MKKLREIEGDNKENTENSTQVKLDEKIVSRDEVEKAKENQAVRIVEKSPGEFKTLQKLKG